MYTHSICRFTNWRGSPWSSTGMHIRRITKRWLNFAPRRRAPKTAVLWAPSTIRPGLDGLNSPLIRTKVTAKCWSSDSMSPSTRRRKSLWRPWTTSCWSHAKHEEKTESKSVYREYNREFLLPKGTNPESIKSSLSKDACSPSRLRFRRSARARSLSRSRTSRRPIDRTNTRQNGS